MTKLRDNATVVPTPDGPVAYVTTSGGLVAHLRSFDAVMAFLERYGGHRFPDLEADYRDAEVAAGRRAPERPLVTVDQALQLVKALDEGKVPECAGR